VTWPELKAPRLQAVLRAVTSAAGGELSLDFLDAPAGRRGPPLAGGPARVGPKTSAAVLSFSRLRKAALPVDSHHHRVAVRTGLIPASLDVGPAHRVLAAQLPPDWDAQAVYDNHEVMMLHGQRCCFHRRPACGRCPVLDLCPAGLAVTGRADRPGPGRPERLPAAEG
jgi:endonuclease-3